MAEYGLKLKDYSKFEDGDYPYQVVIVSQDGNDWLAGFAVKSHAEFYIRCLEEGHFDA